MGRIEDRRTRRDAASDATVSRAPVVRVVVRSVQIAGALVVAAAVFLGALLRGRSLATAVGRACVRFATLLGATFIKVGQIASTRADLIPADLCVELSTLQDQVPPFAFGQVRETIATALGRPVDAVFAQLDPVPVAAASVAQVHRGVLVATGEVVAVKVRRPDIVAKAKLDRAILLALARGLERIVPSLRLVSLEEAVREFCAAVEMQLHLENEAAHNRRFQALFADDPDVAFPKLVPEACADAVLTMEFIEGVREEDLETAGFDVRRIAETGMRVVSRMIFLHGFVHADLHPGNLRFVAPGRVVVLDLGLVGTLTDDDRLTFVQLLYALSTGDGVTVARLFFESSPRTATPDYGLYETEVVAMVDDLRHRGLANLQLTLEIGRLFDVLRRHHIQARSHMTMVNLALMTAEGLGRRLMPDLSLTDAALPYLAEALGVSAPDVGDGAR